MSSQRSKHEITPRGDFFSQLSLRSVKSTEGRSRRDAGAAVSVNSSGLNICAWQVQQVGKATNRCPSLQRLHVKGKGILQPSVSMGTLIRCETHSPLPLLCHHSPHAVNLRAFFHLRCGRKRETERGRETSLRRVHCSFQCLRGPSLLPIAYTALLKESSSNIASVCYRSTTQNDTKQWL